MGAPEVRLQIGEDRRLLAAALGHLTDDQRQLILLRFIENERSSRSPAS